MIKLIVTGACGRMGSAILRLAAADRDFLITHAIETAMHPLIGGNIDVPGALGASFQVEDSLARVIDDCDAVIDFTNPETSLFNFQLCTEKGKAIIIGTTGIPAGSLSEMQGTKGAKAVISPNMSIGVNVLFTLAEKAAAVLAAEYDAEILEMHHKWKKDAPSGTAVKLKEIVKGACPGRAWVEVAGRQGMVGERGKDEIGLLSVRAGDIVGEHTVLFAGTGERLEITHRAYSRDNFARGALEAARWLVRQKNGVYDMRDVLGL